MASDRSFAKREFAILVWLDTIDRQLSEKLKK
jgi:hypothetical protein